MWLWLVVSIVILAACVIFALRIFATSYTFMTPKHDELAAPQSTSIRLFPISRQESSVTELKAKIKTIEDNYLLQFNSLQQRINFLDENKTKKTSKWKEDVNDEGWEEMYYKALKDKEVAEEALDESNQKQEELLLRIKEIESKGSEWVQTPLKPEDQEMDVQSLNNRIEMLERESKVAQDRERILEEELESVKKVKSDYELLQHLYSHLLTEADELKLQLHETTSKDISLTKKISRLSELESNLEISEFKKSDLQKSVEEIIIENEVLSAKLQSLQSKLATEKYA